MDPNAALTTLRDQTAEVEDRIEAGEALDRWVANGGFLPITGYKLGGNTATKFALREEIKNTLRTLRASV